MRGLPRTRASGARSPTATGPFTAGFLAAGVLAAGVLAAGVLAAGLLLGSCAGAPAAAPEEDVLAGLGPEALAYFRLSGTALAAFAPTLIASTLTDSASEDRTPAAPGARPDPAATAGEFARRTRVLGLALLAAVPPTGAPSTGLPRFELVAAGDFPRFGLGLSMATARGWKADAQGWRNEALGLSLANPRSGLILAASGGLGSLLERRKAGLQPLPSGLGGGPWPDVFAWLPDPLARLAPSLGGASDFLAELQLPLEGILLRGELIPGAVDEATGPGSATPVRAADGERRCSLVISLLMRDEASARIYLPAARLLWTLLSRGALSALAEGPAATIANHGRSIDISGVTAKVDSLAALLVALAPRPPREGPAPR